MTVQRMTIVLDETEAQALQGVAQANLRKTPDQARWLLRQALGLNDDSPGENANRGAKVSEAQRAAVAA